MKRKSQSGSKVCSVAVAIFALFLLVGSSWASISGLWGTNGELWDNSYPSNSISARITDCSHAGYQGGDVPIPFYPVVIDVTDAPYNAIPNDSIDDSAAIQAAIDACPTNTGGAVYIPEGIFNVTNTILLSVPNVVLRGAGPEKTVLKVQNERIGILMEGDISNDGGSQIMDFFRGDTEVDNTGLASKAEVGDLAYLMIYLSTAQDIAFTNLLEQIVGGVQIEQYSGSASVKMYGKVTEVSGSTVSLDRPWEFSYQGPSLSGSLNKWNLGIIRPTLHDSGIEDLTIAYDSDYPYAKHFNGTAPGSANEEDTESHAIYLKGCVNCWARNLVIKEACEALSVYGENVQCTFSDITLEADRLSQSEFPLDGEYDYDYAMQFDTPLDSNYWDTQAHAGVQLTGSHMLAERINMNYAALHGLTINATANSVFSDIKAFDLSLDHHRQNGSRNLWTQIDAGLGRMFWLSSGLNVDGIQCGAWETFWNVDSVLDQDFPTYSETDNSFCRGYINIVGINTLADPVTDADPRWFEADIAPDEIEQPNLFQAMRIKRFSENGWDSVPPTAVASADTTQGRGSQTVNFTGSASSDNTGIVSTLWKFGDGYTSWETNPEHAYTEPGTYVASLTVFDDRMLYDTAEVEITIFESDAQYDLGYRLAGSARLENYALSTGHALIGTTNQVVAEGESATTVVAAPGPDYRFVAWSDGGTTAVRTDTDVNESKELMAYFMSGDAPYSGTGPTDLELSANVVADECTNGTPVGVVTATDPTANETFSYVLGDDADGRFAIDASGEITVADTSLLEYASNQGHVITVIVIDSANETYSEYFYIQVTGESGSSGEQEELLVNGSFEDGASNFNFAANANNITVTEAMTNQWIVRETGEDSNMDLADVSSVVSGQDGDVSMMFQIAAKRGLVQVVDVSQTDINGVDLFFSASFASPGRGDSSSTDMGCYQVIGFDDFTGLTVDLGGTYSFTAGTFDTLVAKRTLADLEISETDYTPFSQTVTLASDYQYLAVLLGAVSPANNSDTQFVSVDDVHLSISVMVSNSAPVFSSDPFSAADASEGVYYSESIADSATDANSDSLTYSKISGPSWLSIADNGTLSGEPEQSDVGLNSWTVQAVDGNAGTNTATLEITVDNVNDAPIFNLDPINGNVATEDEVYGDSIAGSATDEDSDPLTYSKVSGPTWLSIASDGGLSGTPANADVGANSWIVQVSDGIETDTATLNITVANVNDAPVFTADPIAGTAATEDAAYSASIAGSATDADSDSLTYSKVSGPTWLSVASDGALSGTPANGDVADPNSFMVQVDDGNGGTDTATLEIIVVAAASAGDPVELLVNGSFDGGATNFNFTSNAGNIPLTLSMAGQWVVRELGEDNNMDLADTSAVVSGQDGSTAMMFQIVSQRGMVQVIDVSQIDISGLDLSFSTAFASPGRGGLTSTDMACYEVIGFNDFAGLTADIGGTYAFTGGTYDELVAKRTLSDTEVSESAYSVFNESVAVSNDYQYLAVLLGGLASANNSDTEFVSVDGVTLTLPGAGNGVPEASNDVAVADEDGSIAITLTGSDPDGDPLTYTVETIPVNGVLTGAVPNVTFIPDADYNGADSFTFTVNDGTTNSAEATISITVNAVNDEPVFTVDPISEPNATEDLAYSDTIAGSATDAESDPLSYSKVSGPAWLSVAAAGTLSGTPAQSDAGLNAFTVQTDDGNGGTDTAVLNITVDGVNDVPAFTADPFSTANATEDMAYSDTIAGSATDAESDPLSYSKVSGPAWLSVAAAGTLSGTPAQSDAGLNAFTVQTDDGNGGTDTAVLNITVDAVNDAPVFTADPFSTANAIEDIAYSDTIAGSATDVESDPLSYSKVSGPAWLAVASDGTLSGTPANGDIGLNSFSVEVDDGNGGTDTAALEINVDAAPVVGPDVRVTEYYLTTGDFSGTTASVTLDQDLADDYYILVRGSRTGDASSYPDNNYARVSAVPGGKGELADSGVANQIVLGRFVADVDWEGVVTVVECGNSASAAGFKLVDIVETSLSGTFSTDTSVAWSDVNQVVLFGGYRGGGAVLAASTGNRNQGSSVFARLYPSGSGTLNWERNAAGETLADAVMTTFVVEWGSEWNVQHVNVAGANGGDGANVTGEYTTSAIGSVVRDNSWVWATGTRVDAGIGDCAEACLVTLGDGVSQSATESSVAVGSEYTDAYDFDVYVLTHSAVAVDYRFLADGNSTGLDVPVTVDATTAGARFGWIYNGVNGTGTLHPRDLFWARYTSDSEITVSRGYDGQAFPAWVQAIDLSGLNN